MKISYMLKREDFYSINEKTLLRFYNKSTQKKTLYVYPALNAIVTARPSTKVKKYLYTEYKVNGSILKRAAVRLYAAVMLNSFGLLAARKFTIPTDADADTLIYPCNKKYRIFDFAKNTVSVTPKDGFPTGDLQNEIAFRENTDAAFVPPLLSHGDNGYDEVIIDGYPVARTAEREKELSGRAYTLWRKFVEPSRQTMAADTYADGIYREATTLLQDLSVKNKCIDTDRVMAMVAALCAELKEYGKEIDVALSHGDLQSGNIWVENQTDKIYIIDWESYGTRALDYDRATLYDGIRRVDRLCRYVKTKDPSHAAVLAEDVIFRLKELINLPENFGAEDFARYIAILEDRYV